MFTDMKKDEEKSKNYLQLGAVNADLCLSFRKQAVERKFKQIEILTLLVEWWLSLDEDSQKNFYHQSTMADKLNFTTEQEISAWRSEIRAALNRIEILERKRKSSI